MKNIFRNTTLLYAYLIFLGYTYLHVYYSNFDIDIFSFLDTGELLLSFLKLADNAMILIALFMIYPVIFLVLYFFIPQKTKEQMDQPILNRSSPKKNQYLNLLFLIGIIVLTIYSIYMLASRFRENLLSRYILYFILFSAFYWVIYFIYINYCENKKDELDLNERQRINFISGFLFSFYVVFFLANYSSQLTKFNLYNKSISFIYENKNVKCSDNLRFVGMTSKYLFLWKYCEKEVFVFERDRLKNIVIK